MSNEKKQKNNEHEVLPSLERLKGEQIGEYRGITLAREVFQLHMKGYRNRQIAEAVGITPTEVKFILYGPKPKKRPR